MIKKIKKSVKSWIAYKKYRLESYGWFNTFVSEPWEDWVEIPLTKTGKILQWIPKLWNTRDWEGTDALRVLDYQLSRNQIVLQNDPHHCEEDSRKLSGPRLAREVQDARNSIAKILEDDFCKKENKELDKKYGKLRMTHGKISLRGKDGKPLAYSTEFKPNSKEYNKLRMNIWNLEQQRKKDEYDNLFKNLKDNIEGWWT